MKGLSEFGLVIFGWLLGSLNPFIERFFTRRRRRKELLSGLAHEANELRFTLSLALVSIRASSQNLDDGVIDLVRPIVLAYEDVIDRIGSEKMRELFAEPSSEIVRGLHEVREAKRDAEGRPLSSYPMPYSLPLLQSRIGELDVLPISQQQDLLRIDSELRLFNEQVAYSRELLSRSFTVTGQNYHLNASNLAIAQQNLGTRYESLIKAINRFLNADGSIGDENNGA